MESSGAGRDAAVMKRIIAIVVLVGLLAMAVPGSPVVGEADARENPPTCIREPCGPPCVIGAQSHCLVQIVCVRDPCP